MLKRRLLTALLCVTTFLFTSSVLAAEPAFHMQLIAADNTNSRMISWLTPLTKDKGYIEYKKTGSTISTKQPALSYNLDNKTGHKLLLANLQPDTTYQYRLGSAKDVSNWHTLTTAKPNMPFTALIFGDSQSFDYGVWGKTLHNAINANPHAGFFINMGDLVDYEADSQWQSWYSNASDVVTKIPVAPVLGNHETFLKGAVKTPPALFTFLLPVPHNGPANLPGQVYSFTYGPTRFIVLNTQAAELKSWYPKLLTEEKQYLEKTLSSATEKWKIVLMHKSPLTFTANAPLNDLGSVFIPVFDKFHVDVVFTAHTHQYARTKPLVNGKSAAKGTLYISTGRSGTKVYPQTKQRAQEAAFYNPLDMPNYLTLFVSQKTLTVKCFKQNGKLVDTITLDK